MNTSLQGEPETVPRQRGPDIIAASQSNQVIVYCLFVYLECLADIIKTIYTFLYFSQLLFLFFQSCDGFVSHVEQQSPHALSQSISLTLSVATFSPSITVSVPF